MVTTLDKKHLDVLALAAQGLTDKQIARSIQDTEHVAQNCMREVYAKLQIPYECNRRVAAVRWYWEHERNGSKFQL